MTQSERQAKEDLLDILKHIRNTTKLYSTGLCGFVDHLYDKGQYSSHLGYIAMFLRRLMSTWPKHSGESAFPIKVFPSPCDSYFAAKHKGTLYNRRGEQGRLRYELLDWMIQELKKDLANEQH